MKQQFGPRLRVWIEDIIGPPVALMGIVLILYLRGTELWWAAPLVLAPVVWSNTRAASRILRNRITLTDAGIIFEAADHTIRIGWSEIKAARLHEDRSTAELWIGTMRGEWALPVGKLDSD